MPTRIVLILTMLTLFNPSSLLAATDQRTALVIGNSAMHVPFPPVPIISYGLSNIGYELEFQSPGEDKYTLVSAEALNAETREVLLRLEGKPLKQFYHSPSVLGPTEDEWQNGTLKLRQPRISFWLRLAPLKVPKMISHKLYFKSRLAGNTAPIVLAGGTFKVSTDKTPLVLSAPLRGEGWLSHEAMYSNHPQLPAVHHFLIQYTERGVTYVPFRHAVDFVRFDPVTHKDYTGDRSQNKSWYGYGQDILAAMDGTIADKQDGIRDNVVVGTMSESPVGNYVIMDAGNSQYVGYAHLIPGSIRVRKGDAVKKGQVIGKLGNSGGSFVPHLHLQVMDRPSMLNAEGLPFVLESITTIGECPALGLLYNMRLFSHNIKLLFEIDSTTIGMRGSCRYFDAPVIRNNESFGNLEIVRFPQ